MVGMVSKGVVVLDVVGCVVTGGMVGVVVTGGAVMCMAVLEKIAL